VAAPTGQGSGRTNARGEKGDDGVGWRGAAAAFGFREKGEKREEREREMGKWGGTRVLVQHNLKKVTDNVSLSVAFLKIFDQNFD